jgi:hypothetical protein
MFDKPAINVGYNPPNKDIYPYNYTRFYAFDHYKPIVDSGAVQVATDEDEIRRYLREAIEIPEKYSYLRTNLMNSMFHGKPNNQVITNFIATLNKINE